MLYRDIILKWFDFIQFPILNFDLLFLICGKSFKVFNFLPISLYLMYKLYKFAIRTKDILKSFCQIFTTTTPASLSL